MNPLPDRQEIKTRADFEKWIALLKAYAHEGRLQQYYPPDWEKGARVALKELEDHGPWPDIIDMYFEVPDRPEKYLFVVNVYRGSGGCWEKL